jgi:hypothetical protein
MHMLATCNLWKKTCSIHNCKTNFKMKTTIARTKFPIKRALFFSTRLHANMFSFIDHFNFGGKVFLFKYFSIKISKWTVTVWTLCYYKNIFITDIVSSDIYWFNPLNTPPLVAVSKINKWDKDSLRG